MNIFVTDPCPVASANTLCNKHVVKMILETAQMLSTAVRLSGYEGDDVYRVAYKNHPCTVWVRTTRANFDWAVQHGLALGDEYTRRYGKIHKSVKIIEAAKANASYIPEGPLTAFPLCMHDEFKVDCPYESYKRWLNYKYEKWSADGRPPVWTN